MITALLCVLFVLGTGVWFALPLLDREPEPEDDRSRLLEALERRQEGGVQ